MLAMAEADLIREACAGDHAAFEALLGPLLDPAYRIALLMLGRHDAAEDAVQEAALHAWRKLEQFRGTTLGIRPWFMAIVVNACRGIQRGRWWSVVTLQAIDRVAPSWEENFTARSELLHAVRGLKQKLQLALFLYYYLDLPIEAVAATLGISVNGAKSRIRRALEQLRAQLQLEEMQL